MPLEINDPHEYDKWASYFGSMFPTAGPVYLGDLTQRMCKTFGRTSVSIEERRMTLYEYLERLMQMDTRLRQLPPDPKNKLMGD